MNAPPATGSDDTELPARRLSGRMASVAAALSTALAGYALYWVVAIVPPQPYRLGFLLLALLATFLLYPGSRKSARITPADWVLCLASLVALAWPLLDLEEFPYRAATPGTLDLALGALAIVLVLEATRRTVGWILPATAVAFLIYGWAGPLFELVGLGQIAHRGYGLDRQVGTLYMTLEGLFGVPLAVAATYIILFTIYGAVLEHSGAGRFFIDWALAATGRSGSPAAPGRTVTVAGFLLGTVSGSGVATTVTLGSVAWPMLRRSGYSPDAGGAILSAGGIGAILSPPTLGAAAFLIAEFLQISYLQVLVMATIPTLLYYLSILLMIEADARRMKTTAVAIETRSLRDLTLRSGYHFSSLFVIAGLMFAGLTAFRSVFWATVLAVALSFLDREHSLGPRKLLLALEAGGKSVLPVAATTATAGIIVGIVTLTGLGLKLAGLIVAWAGGSLLLTVAYAAIAVWLLGLAVPVTASYIIAAVMVAPALVQVGVPAIAAHMFIFYYAVLSEVSPPTALSPFAAAAITGGNPFRTMLLTWKYTLPAFLVPFVFCTRPEGLGLLMAAPVGDIVVTSLTAALGIGALGLAFGGWLRGAIPSPLRWAAALAGLSLCYAEPWTDATGLLLSVAVLAAQLARSRGQRTSPGC